MSSQASEITLDVLIAPYPSIKRIVDVVCGIWPEHARYILKSMTPRDDTMMQTTETLAQAAIVLAEDRLEEIAHHYRWTCDQLRAEELFFHREGRYRFSTFAEADEAVYSDAEYMKKYMDGLLISQILWFNHAASCDFFLSATPDLLGKRRRYLEIGPGHGLMMYLALRDFDLDSAAAWDLSAVSIAQTQAALEKLGYDGCEFSVQNVTEATDKAGAYDLLVISEVLEHLEDPKSVMRSLCKLINPDDGLIFVNVPINSPSPDHLYLMETLNDARALLTDTGFEIVSEAFFATQGAAIDRALRNKISISASMLARPA